jgi:hypothetical protein
VRAGRATLALAFALMLGSCSLTYDAASLGVPATLASPAGQPAAGDRFVVSSKAVFGLWGLARLKEPSLRKALAAQLGGGAGVADVKIKERSRWTDLLVTLLTAGIIVPRTVTFEGVVTK